MSFSGFSLRSSTLVATAVLAGVVPVASADAATVGGRVSGHLPRSASCAAPPGHGCFDPSRGNRIPLRVNFPGPLAGNVSVCFDFTFVGDLLDPGEELNFTVGDSSSGSGFTPVDGVSQSQRTLCAPVSDPAFADLADGHALITVFAFQGSFRLSDVQAYATSS